MSPGMKILIVEDEADLARNLQIHFRRRLAEVKVVPSGERALEVAREFRPDVLVLDYRLPGIDGLDTFAQFSGLPMQYGCVMITGDASEALPQVARTVGIRHVLEKPFSFSQLESAFESTPMS